MSYSDDTAAYWFTGQDTPEYREHAHDYLAWKVTAEGWVFACDCGNAVVRSDAWMQAEGKRREA